jgi:succinate dehydrogenase/fumarate reductase flavoprotein subunit
MTKPRHLPSSWDIETDIVVVGYGYAGGISSIEAKDAGVDVLLLEKMSKPGGISICSGGGLRTASNVNSAFSYLKATCGGLTPDAVLRAMAEGMTEIPAYMEEMARINSTKIRSIPYIGNYPFPGYEDLGFSMYGAIPGFDPLTYYPHVRGLRGGARNFKVVEDNLNQRGVKVLLDTPVKRLIGTPDGRVVGVLAKKNGNLIAIKARRGVILTCGGFEADEELKRQFLQGTDIISAAFHGNTGDGIRMSQEAGASLWHMWNFHGSYGLRHKDPNYPYGLRLRRLPDWVPGHPILSDVKMAWIVVDQYGQRYMNEYPPYAHDVGHRPMQYFETETQSYPRIPSYIIFDEEGRKLYPLVMPTFNDLEVFFEWSEDNLAEVELGILKKAGSIEEMALEMRLNSDTLKETVDRWNRFCSSGADSDFGRPQETMFPVRRPPYYYAQIWPIVSNTHGGPVHNEYWQILDAFGEPIPGLYEAGELGGIFGFLYLAGGNLAECYIGGWTAARHAAKNEPWRG